MLSNFKPGMRRISAAALAIALLAPAAYAMPVQAVAAEAASSESSALVRGADALSWGDSFECATVSGLGGSTLYADVTVGGKVVTKDMTYAYDSATDTFGVVQLNADASYVLEHSGDMQLNFYTAKTAERGDASALLSAKVYAVCMQVDGQAVEGGMIGIRTARESEATLAIEAPTQIVRDGATYSLVGGSKVAPELIDGVLYVSYEKVDEAEGVSAAVVYVDEQGNELTRDSYTLASGEKKSVELRKSVESDEKVYTPCAKTAQVTLTADAPETRVYCLERAKADTSTQEVEIAYVSTEGKQLMADRVSVGAGGFLYSPATTFSQAHEAAVASYTLTGATDSLGNTYTADEAKTLTLARNGADKYTLTYAPEATELTYAVNFALVSAGKGGNTNVSIAKTEKATLTSASAATVELPETLEADGTTYTRFGSASSLSYAWTDLETGRELTDTVYYVAADVVTPSAYEVEVRYVDAVSGTQIGSATLACEPTGEALSITSPESVTYEGAEYERLGGQSAPITHRFYAPYRTYTVYYARPGSMSEGDTTVTRTVVVDGGVRYYTIAADGTVTTGDTSSADGTTAGGLVATAPYTTVETTSADGSDTSATDVTAPSGDTAYEERIADEQTPLASGEEGGQTLPYAAIAAGVALALAAAAIVFVLLRKKRNSADDVKGE